jgi:hypothetical protein
MRQHTGDEVKTQRGVTQLAKQHVAHVAALHFCQHDDVCIGAADISGDCFQMQNSRRLGLPRAIAGALDGFAGGVQKKPLDVPFLRAQLRLADKMGAPRAKVTMNRRTVLLRRRSSGECEGAGQSGAAAAEACMAHTQHSSTSNAATTRIFIAHAALSRNFVSCCQLSPDFCPASAAHCTPHPSASRPSPPAAPTPRQKSRVGYMEYRFSVLMKSNFAARHPTIAMYLRAVFDRYKHYTSSIVGSSIVGTHSLGH